MNFALVPDDEPMAQLEVLHRTLERNAGRFSCLVVVPGIANPARRRAHTRVLLRLLGPAYVAKLLWRYARGPFKRMEELARHHGVALIRCQGVNEPDFRTLMVERKIDAVISLTASIYKQPTLSMQGVRFYNFHGSILPANKGPFPFFWAFMTDAPQGMTLHEIDLQIDEGAPLFQCLLPDLGPGVPAAGEALMRSYPALIERALNHIEQRLPPALLGLDLQPSYGPVPGPEDLRAYFRKLREVARVHG